MKSTSTNPKKRASHQRKKAQKGVKSIRGKAEYYDEVKDRISVAVTPTARQGLDTLSQQFNLSRSELIEQIGRGTIQLIPPDS